MEICMKLVMRAALLRQSKTFEWSEFEMTATFRGGGRSNPFYFCHLDVPSCATSHGVALSGACGVACLGILVMSFPGQLVL
jgi:hypothetical protein